jgi:alpha-tubulin suppressor-like RCC1 family protein
MVNRNGHVWCFGLNKEGQLGLGDLKTRHIPTRNERLNNTRMITAGFAHGLALGKIWYQEN